VRPLFHPSIEDVTVEAILHALSDPVRVAIFAQIVDSDCSRNCSNFLKVSERSIPKSTLSQHFKALREAGLIRGERRGIEMHNTSRCAEIEKRFPGLIKAIVNAHFIQSEQKMRAVKPSKRTSITPANSGRSAGSRIPRRGALPGPRLARQPSQVPDAVKRKPQVAR
jgi:DNA-binding transcriptional ArsR family regulator